MPTLPSYMSCRRNGPQTTASCCARISPCPPRHSRYIRALLPRGSDTPFAPTTGTSWQWYLRVALARHILPPHPLERMDLLPISSPSLPLLFLSTYTCHLLFKFNYLFSSMVQK